MGDLQALIKEFGVHIGLLLFILYKEVPLWLRKRNGQWVDYADNTKVINEINSNLSLHITDDRTIQSRIAADLEVQKALQTQINIGIQKELTQVSVKLDKVYDLILSTGKGQTGAK